MQTERDNRLKAMGEMAIKIAHEVRNPLGSIELFASILRRELDGAEDLQKMSGRIITEVKSLDNMISNLLLFTRPQTPLLHSFDLSEFIKEFAEFIQPVVTKNDVRLEYRDALRKGCMINGDRDLLKQVFLNLTLNALQAMPGGGAITISMKDYREEQQTESRWAEIIFSDTGVGIDPASIDKIFHPFYTTREKGTGLGLAIVHNIIESHQGIIEARSRQGEGTSFYISLPAHAGCRNGAEGTEQRAEGKKQD